MFSALERTRVAAEHQMVHAALIATAVALRADGVRFEITRAFALRVFKTRASNHSAASLREQKRYPEVDKGPQISLGGHISHPALR